MEKEILEAIKREAEKRIPHYGTHGFEHTLRVFNLCKRIGFSRSADRSVLLPAALLHDIARDEGDHEQASSSKARGILESMNYPEDKIKAVADAISTHSFSGGRSPESLEAEILSDADKLDAIGAIGIYRAAMYSAENGRPIEAFIAHFHEKLLKLKDTLHTEEARRLADSRHRFMLDFLEQHSREQNINSTDIRKIR
jgi:uncharacterized protein